ncbi:MAG TPA: hypothetical protein VNZ26_23640 [Vicinamibacterales bacterium]|nr:hypothetical protein [Vicinamibacterales bacterium]
MTICSALTVLIVTASTYALEMPLKLDGLVTGTSSHVRLTNTGTQTITAWSLATLASTTTDGATKTHREVHTADGYLSEITHGLPGSSDLLDRLQPGESRELPLDSLPPGSTAEVVAVILEDGTGIGDEQIISAIFARRVKERDALRNVVQAFNDILPSRQGTAALDALRNLFSDLVQRDDSIPCRAALDAVQTYSRSTNADQIDQSLKVYSAFVTREYELALKHSQRKLP